MDHLKLNSISKNIKSLGLSKKNIKNVWVF